MKVFGKGPLPRMINHIKFPKKNKKQKSLHIFTEIVFALYLTFKSKGVHTQINHIKCPKNRNYLIFSH